jgi:hypothetical protein
MSALAAASVGMQRPWLSARTSHLAVFCFEVVECDKHRVMPLPLLDMLSM